MVDARLYRAAFAPLVLVIVVAAFSLAKPPAPLSTTLAPDAFSAQDAMSLLRGMLARYPDRRPGGTADNALAAQIAHTFQQDNLTVTTRRFDARTIDGKRSLVTVIGSRPGTTASSIVLLAHRDAAGHGAEAELSGTAALLELAQVFSGRIFSHTIVLVSTSGGSGGDAGAADFAAHLPGPVDAVLVLGDVAGARAHRPFVLPYSDSLGGAPPRLQRTVQAAVTQETGSDPGQPGFFSELAHLALPLTPGEEGVLGAHGVPAVLVQVSGERGPSASALADGTRMDNEGRALLRTVNALDGGPGAASGPRAGLTLHGNLLPTWSVRLIVLAAILPALLAAVDGLARARRRRQPTGALLLWTLSLALPFLFAAVLALLLRLAGLFDTAVAAPVPDGASTVAPGVLAAVIVAFAGGWVARRLLLRERGVELRPGTGAAGVVVVLVLTGASLVVWAFNPYAALLLVPAVHLWLLLADPEPRLPRAALTGAALLGLVAPLLAVAYHVHEQALSIGHAAWSIVVLVAGGSFGPLALLLASVIAGAGAAAVLVALRGGARRGPPEEPEITVRGPLTYAGPGSLGGTESALRR
jgi:Peptidase family M28